MSNKKLLDTPLAIWRRKYEQQPHIKAKKALRRKQYTKKNPVKYRNMLKKSNLKRQYGISLEEYEEMFSSQGGKCKICFDYEKGIDPRTELPFNLAVDHDHKTGRIRGLLCANCNRAIGLFKDNPETILSAHNYLTVDVA